MSDINMPQKIRSNLYDSLTADNADTGMVGAEVAEEKFCNLLAPGDWITYTDNGDGVVGAGDSFTEKQGDELYKFRLESSNNAGVFNVMWLPKDGGKPVFMKETTTEDIERVVDDYVTRACDVSETVRDGLQWEDNGDDLLGVGDVISEGFIRFYLTAGELSDTVDLHQVANGAMFLQAARYNVPLVILADALFSNPCVE